MDAPDRYIRRLTRPERVLKWLAFPLAAVVVGGWLLLTAPLVLGADIPDAPDWTDIRERLEECAQAPPTRECLQGAWIGAQAVLLCDRTLAAWESEGRPELTDARRAARVFDCLDQRNSGLPLLFRPDPMPEGV